MLQILKAIKQIIEKFIVNKTPLTEGVSAGDTTIKLASTRRFCPGDVIVVFSENSGEGEVHVITETPDIYTVIIDTPLVESWSASDGYMVKLIGFESGTETWIDGVYIGDPAVIPRYPAITINGVSRNEEWMTLESTKADYDIDITIYVEAAHFETQMELMYTYARNIETALFRSLYPLVGPYDTATLTSDLDASDIVMHIDSADFFNCGMGWIFLESYEYLRENQPIEDLGGGAYKLNHPPGCDFPAGSKVIRPWRHIFNAIPKGTQYGTVSKGTMLKAAKISYTCSEETRRYFPYIDPLTF